MISVSDARRHIAAYTSKLQPTQVSLTELGDLVSAESIRADRPVPAMDRVMMDGIALQQEAWASGRRQFAVAGCQRAGDAPLLLKDAHHCIEVMTGAMLPIGCTAVVRYEDLTISGSDALINPDVTVPLYGSVHKCGSDAQAGVELVAAGTRLGAPEWAVAASVGQQMIAVHPKPRVAVLTSGDEVLPVHSTPREYEIRGSNAWAIKAALARHGFDVTRMVHVPDDPRVVSETIAELLTDSDVIVTTGGVSKGKHDYLPEVLADLKVQKIFHNVAQRPGKPLWFGVSDGGALVFGLPGNPVSVLVGLRVYVLPALYAMSGRKARPQHARLQETITFKPDLTLFQPVKLQFTTEATILALPVRHNTSGDFSALVGTDGIIELPQGKDFFEAGSVHEFFAWNPTL